jgi:hypothetical protein
MNLSLELLIVCCTLDSSLLADADVSLTASATLNTHVTQPTSVMTLTAFVLLGNESIVTLTLTSAVSGFGAVTLHMYSHSQAPASLTAGRSLLFLLIN